MKVPNWLERLMKIWYMKDCNKLACQIADMGQENGNAQTYLNAAKSNLYNAAREFELMAESWK